jgi:hypothetical protein
MENNEDIPQHLKGTEPKTFTQGPAVVIVILAALLAIVGIVSVFLK